MHFENLTQRMVQLYHAREFQTAYDLVTSEAPNHPESSRVITVWRISLLSRLDRTREAMDLFADLLHNGHWMAPYILENDPDLAALREEPLFQTLAAQCQTRYQAALAEAAPRRIALEPEQPGKPAPLLMALHSNGSTAGREVGQWRPAVREGWRVAMLQSSQLYDENRYAWTDQAVAIPEVKRHLNELMATTAVDPSRLLVGGMSMGAGTVLKMALTGEIPARGFVAVAPWLPDLTELKEALSARRPNGVRGYLIAGEADTVSLAITRELHALMAEHGLACELELHPGLGHSYPVDFEHSLHKALAFLLAD